MADLDRHRVSWTGFLGASGVSTFYVDAGIPANAHLETFFTALCEYLPPSVHLTVEPAGDTIDSATGALVGSWTDTAPTGLAGTGGGQFSGVSGLLLRWYTDTFLSGRRLRGHTFIVPISIESYDASGQIASGYVVGATAAQTALIASLGSALKIWERPRVAAGAYTDRRGVLHPAVTARSGGYGPVITGSCRPTVTELRSRRD